MVCSVEASGRGATHAAQAATLGTGTLIHSHTALPGRRPWALEEHFRACHHCAGYLKAWPAAFGPDYLGRHRSARTRSVKTWCREHAATLRCCTCRRRVLRSASSASALLASSSVRTRSAAFSCCRPALFAAIAAISAARCASVACSARSRCRSVWTQRDVPPLGRICNIANTEVGSLSSGRGIEHSLPGTIGLACLQLLEDLLELLLAQRQLACIAILRCTVPSAAPAANLKCRAGANK